MELADRNSKVEDENHQNSQSSAKSNESIGYASTMGLGVHNASASPSKDWFKISDLADRRRIQNRIAQRDYREYFIIISRLR